MWHGSWKDQGLSIDEGWLVNILDEKNNSIDWEVSTDDVERFMKLVELKNLSLWNDKFFMSKLKNYINRNIVI